MAIGHRQAVGEEDEVGGGNDSRETSYRVDEQQVEGSMDDEERQETRGNEGERSRTREYKQAASTVEEHCQHTMKDDNDSPAPPIPTPPPPSPDDPERRHDVDAVKSNKTATRQRADALHDPGGQTVAPEDKPPSVRLEGESGKALSLYVEANHVEVDNVDIGTVNHDHDTQQSPRRPVGTPDGDEHHPNGPTEPPDEKEGEADKVETKELRRGDEPRGRGGSREESKEVEAEAGDQNGEDDCQRDGRTNDTGRPTSSTSPKRPTRHVNPPYRRGRLEPTPTDVSQPELGCDGNGTELQGEYPRATRLKDEGTKAHMSTPPTPPASHELPNWVITRA
ncbi:hypothetical protein BDN67DRAFT_1016429 [Paxillus ammoniavirescens]|nr:hypothetical protein BDN67DRAFT_1016429 [Paxillus ammoniavirescens]